MPALTNQPQGMKDKAARLFRRAAADCPNDFIEQGAAFSESQ
jgi:hypothetical protein